MQKLKIAAAICIEGPNVPYDIEPLSRHYPEIRFLLLKEETSPGEKINLGIAEAESGFVLATWSDMKIPAPLISAKALRSISEAEVLCTVPVLRNHKSEIVPSIQIPALIKGKLKLIPWLPAREGMKSIVPFDYCGIYLKNIFLLSGGFDCSIKNPYWQKLDFGFRAFLWGNKIRYSPELRLSYSAELLPEDTTADESYKIFFLKNLAVRFNGEMGVLPYSKSLGYLLRSDTGPIYAYKEFREVKKWVEINRCRFKTDAQSLLARWEMPE